jgi:hypothetical protein
MAGVLKVALRCGCGTNTGLHREVTYVNSIPTKIIMIVADTHIIAIYSVTHDNNRQGVHHARRYALQQ